MAPRSSRFIAVLTLLVAGGCATHASDDAAQTGARFGQTVCNPAFGRASSSDLGPTDVFTVDGDTPMPVGFIEWLDEAGWPIEHADWHRVRRFDAACGSGVDWTTVDDRDVPQCPAAQRLVDLGLYRADAQENAPGDGLPFMMFHRIMIRSAQTAFPEHADLFGGFAHIPRDDRDPENPMPGRPIRWSDGQLEALEILENIEDHVDRWEDEDAFARWMQANFVWTDTNPQRFVDDPTAGIHFALHAQWNIPGSPYALAGEIETIYNRAFWSLHGWMDTVWEHYRVARGQRESDPEFQAVWEDQCEEWADLRAIRLGREEEPS